MSEIKIHIFLIGKVCVAPELPFGGEHYSALKTSGVLDKKSKRLWLPVSAYLIECAHGNVRVAGSTPAASTKFKSQTVLLLSGTLFFLLRLRSAVDECVAGRLPENIRTTARKYGKSCWGPKNRLCRQFP